MMKPERSLKDEIVVQNTSIDHVQQLEDLQVLVFPSLADDERFKKQHYKRHIELFKAGQFVALLGDKVVGMSTTIRMDFDFDNLHHTFSDIISGGYLDSHNPDGEWLYGLDIGIHPEHRRQGIATQLYNHRNDLVKQLGLSGQLTVGMMSGYGERKDSMSPTEYFEKLKNREITDPTLSMQMHVGFEPIALVPDYINDPICDNYGVLIVLKPY